MKSVRSWNDLCDFGIVLLTGEACGLSYRLLCDVTAPGAAVIARMLGVPKLKLAAPWKCGSSDAPHIGSIMLAREMLTPLSVFALLEAPCEEVWQTRSEGVIGFEVADSPEYITKVKQRLQADLVRRFGYWGTAGDRNVHVASGRVT